MKHGVFDSIDAPRASYSSSSSSSLPLSPESSALMAADPFPSGLRRPDGALMPPHRIRMLPPFLDWPEPRCVRAGVHACPCLCACASLRFFFLFTGAALKALRLRRYLAGHAADPVSLAEPVNSSRATDGNTGLHLMRGRRI